MENSNKIYEPETAQKAAGKKSAKNQNPNENHNTKKQSMGPNTKR